MTLMARSNQSSPFSHPLNVADCLRLTMPSRRGVAPPGFDPSASTTSVSKTYKPHPELVFIILVSRVHELMSNVMDAVRDTENSSDHLTQHCSQPNSGSTRLMIDGLQPNYSIIPQSSIQVRLSSMPQLAEVCLLVSSQIKPV